jgi:hypothetical protein
MYFGKEYNIKKIPEPHIFPARNVILFEGKRAFGLKNGFFFTLFTLFCCCSGKKAIEVVFL